MSKLSPMMQQYFTIKEKHKEHIVFFRLGDFYEMFFDDALLASKELELTLTGRDCGLEERAPMCGVPYHSSEAYIQRLIEKGYKVAICEQTEAPQKGKAIVNRDVVRVVTPGTIMENSMLNEGENNFIASVYISDDVNLCFCDTSTGSLQSTSLNLENIENNLKAELYKFRPREIIINSKLLELKWLTQYIKDVLKCSVELIPNEEYNKLIIEEAINKQFSQNEFTSNKKYCLWQLINYLSSTQVNGVEELCVVENYDTESFMNLSFTTTTNLELFETIRTKEKKGSLLWVLDNTKTSFGKRFLKQVIAMPLMDKKVIDLRLNAVEDLYNNSRLSMEIQDYLKNIQDMERLCTRANFGNATPRDVFSLANSLEMLNPLKIVLKNSNDNLVNSLNAEINPLNELSNILKSAIMENPPALIKDGGFIKDNFDNDVDHYRHLLNNSMEILTEIENRLKQETGIAKLKVGYNRVFGYYIEVTNSYKDLVPETFIRKQTLAGAERYITQELKELEQEILSANEKLIEKEKIIFTNLLNKITEETQAILKTTKAISYIDVLVSFATVSRKNNYIKPTITLDDELKILDGRHPVVEKVLKDDIFIPNDTLLDCDKNRVNIITGPNMAGKSTYMRQTAVLVIMAQIGCFVPAKYAKIPLVDAVFTRVGASDDLSSGRSTFMVEMSEVSEILSNATEKSLVILDEIGRGTSTFDGMSIAKSVVEFIYSKENNLGCKTLFATHYHELTDMEKEISGIINYNIAVKKRGDDITFLRKIVRGGADDSYGIEVAKLAGVPDKVISRAREILSKLEENSVKEKLAVKQLSFEDTEILLNINNKPSIDNNLLNLKEEILKIDLNILTPIEALNALNNLKKLVIDKE